MNPRFECIPTAEAEVACGRTLSYRLRVTKAPVHCDFATTLSLADSMIFEDCPHCTQRMGFKRNIGVGSLIAVLVTFGWWLWALIFYPVRCVRCGYCPRFSAWQKVGIGVVIAIPILMGIGLYFGHSSRATETQHVAPIVEGKPATPAVIIKAETVHTEAPSSEEWPLEAFPSRVGMALSEPDMAVHGSALTSRAVLRIESEPYVIKTESPADGCADIGCRWHLVDSKSGKDVLSGYSSVHIGPENHNNAPDLVLEDRASIREYQYDGTRYAAVNCYQRAYIDKDSPVQTEACPQISE